jgi:dolichol-phosphate mannosyltransferase
MKVLITIPTLNESENIEDLINSIFESTMPDQVNILVVDDNSPDGTASIVKNLIIGKYKNKLFLLERDAKKGIASAYIAGFRWGLAKDYDLFGEMDADFSHNPKYLPGMIDISEKYDFVIGSRYIGAGGMPDWGFIRKLISWGGSLYSRLILGIPIKDLTGGFNLWKRNILEKIDLDNIVSKGFLFQVELKFRAYKLKFNFMEFPIVFKNRAKGKSKMSFLIFLEAILNVWKLKAIMKKDETCKTDFK